MRNNKLFSLFFVLATVGFLVIRIYSQDKAINSLSAENKGLTDRINKMLAVDNVYQNKCEIEWPENIHDYTYSYSKDEGFCDGEPNSVNEWWTRSVTPNGELGIKWSQDGVIRLALLFDNKTRILKRILDPNYLVEENLHFTDKVLSNRFYLISDVKQFSPDGKYLVFSVDSCAGCGDISKLKDELYLYDTTNDKVKSLGIFNRTLDSIVWAEKDLLSIDGKILRIK